MGASTALALSPNIEMLPSGVNVVRAKGNKILVQRKGRHSRYKMPKKVRDKIAASARRFKIPLLTGAAVALPALVAANMSGGFQRVISSTTGMFSFLREMIANYTGVRVDYSGGVTLEPKRAFLGLVPLGAIMFARRFGLFKRPNQELSKSKIPIALT